MKKLVSTVLSWLFPFEQLTSNQVWIISSSKDRYRNDQEAQDWRAL
jgi:hypothetical protein